MQIIKTGVRPEGGVRSNGWLGVTTGPLFQLSFRETFYQIRVIVSRSLIWLAALVGRFA